MPAAKAAAGPPSGRRMNWKTSSQRRSHRGCASGTGAVGSSFSSDATARTKGGGGVGGGVGGVGGRGGYGDRRLNPYKPLRGSRGHAGSGSRSGTDGVMRRPSEDLFGDDDDDVEGGDLLDRLDLGDDDDDLGLDHILSSIVDAKPEGSDRRDGGEGVSSSAKSEGGFEEEEKKEISEGSSNDRHRVAEVNFGSSEAGIEPAGPGGGRTTPVPSLNGPALEGAAADGISPVSNEDHSTLWSESDGDATRNLKQMAQPAFASGGLEAGAVASGLETSLHSLPRSNKGKGSGNSLVDSLLSDIMSVDGNENSNANNGDDDGARGFSAEGPHKSATPARGSGRHSPGGYRNRHRPVRSKANDPAVAGNDEPRDDAPQSSSAAPSSRQSRRRSSGTLSDLDELPPLPARVTAANPPIKGGGDPEDETLSAVTDPTESPFIYTYKKPRGGDEEEDDTVSQITSSLAGNSSMGSSRVSSLASARLRNVPNVGAKGTTKSSSRGDGRLGLTWMSDGNDAGGGGLRGASRMIRRKPGGGMVVPGPYGRDRGGGHRRSSKPTRGGAGSSVGGAGGGGGSGSGGGGSGSYEGSESNLDEIDFALNAGANAGGPGSRTRRKPLAHRRGGDSGAAELSAVASSRDGESSSSRPYVRASGTMVESNVSRLGMGGASCLEADGASCARSVSSIRSDSSASTLGFVQSLAELTLVLRHRAGRFFLPNPPAETRRKKFDRSDSDIEDLADELLMEEGSAGGPSSRRGRRPNGAGRGTGAGGAGREDDDDEEEIDYFGRAMAASSSGPRRTTPPAKRRRKYCWQGGAGRVAGLIAAATVGIVWFRTRGGGGGGGGHDGYVAGRAPDRGSGFRQSRTGVQRRYGAPASDAGEDLATTSDYDALAGRPGAGRLGRPADEGDPPDARPVEDEYPRPPSDLRDDSDEGGVRRGEVRLPPDFAALADVDGPYRRGVDVPFYWHVPRSGGGTTNDVLGSCLHLTLAADAGGSGGRGKEETLKVLHFSKQVSYVNVDTSTHQGISRAKNLDLVSSGMADVVISPLLHDAATLFTPARQGRMFAIFRHPVERAASLFYFIQETQWKQLGTRNDQFADITIEQFYSNGFAENNWMTRFLTNELTKPELTEDDLNVAKEVLRWKCLVGLLEEKGETFDRFQKYFGWEPKDETERSCLEKKLNWAWPMKHKHPTIEEDSRASRLIVGANKFDLRLYQYAKELFVQQGEQLFPR
ncbi:hypothetical protein ACHAWF_015929 [Thalassiosira exigua]